MKATPASARALIIIFGTASLNTHTALAQTSTDSVQAATAAEETLELLRAEIKSQSVKLDALQRELTNERANYNTLMRRVDGLTQDDRRARGLSPQLISAQGRSDTRDVATNPESGKSDSSNSSSAVQPPQQDDQNSHRSSVTAAAQIFEQTGILTPKGHLTIEPSIQYGYASNNRVALVGYTIIPALLIGLVDVREVKRNTITGALSARYGVSNRFEVEAKIPYVYRSDSTVSREIFTGSATDRAFDTSGKGIGDIDFGARYQFNDGGSDHPYFIGTLRYKTHTGKDPFSTVTDCVTRCIGNTTGTGLPLELPTGSGFNSLQPGLTWLFPSDPAVFFGSFTYIHNFSRKNVSRTVLNGEHEFLGKITAGDILGANFGIGLALNDKASLSMGIDLNSVGRTKQNDLTVPGSVRTQLATLLFGYSYRLSDKRTISFSVGGGLTRDTPDLTLNLKIPINL